MINMGEDGKGKTVKEIMEIEVAGKKKGKIAKIMEERTDEAEAQYREVQLKRLVAEEEARIKKVQSNAGTVATPQNQVQTLFAGRKPEEVKEILDSLEPQHIQKLALIANAMNPNQQSMLMQMLRQPDRSINDTIQLIKTVVELGKPQQQQGITLQGIAALMKVMKEEKKAPPVDPMKIAIEYVKPFFDAMSEKDRAFYQTQMENLKGQIINPVEWLKQMKEVAPSIGYVPASQAKGGVNQLELEKMRMGHERWKAETDWKIQKELADMKLKQQSDRDKMKLIGKTVDIALKKAGPALDALVKVGQQKMEGLGTGRATTKQMATGFLCPECAKKGVETIIDVADMPDIAKCSVCGTEFPKKA